MSERKEWLLAILLLTTVEAILEVDLETSGSCNIAHVHRNHRRNADLEHLAEAVTRDPALGDRARLDPDFEPLHEDEAFLRITASESATP